MIKKTILIDGKETPFVASAAVPRMYRLRFRRDIFSDLSKLNKAVKKKEDDGDSLELDILFVFENVAYIMAKHADPKQPETPEEWLDQFDTFSIYEVLPQLLELWHLNIETQVQSKKNLNKVAGK